jgi:hypothetical protein
MQDEIMPNDNPLRTHVYVSSATVDFDAAMLESLLAGAREFNTAHGLTGLLLFCNGNFMQCIEGRSEDIDAALTRISASRRHKDIYVLYDAPVAQRSFADWSMALGHVSPSEWNTLRGAEWTSDADDTGLTLLKEFWRDNARA